MFAPIISRLEHCFHFPSSFCCFSFISYSEKDFLQEADNLFAAVNLNNNYFLIFEGQQHFLCQNAKKSHITPPKSPRIKIEITALEELFSSDVQTFGENLLKHTRAKNNVLFWFGVLGWGMFFLV